MNRIVSSHIQLQSHLQQYVHRGEPMILYRIYLATAMSILLTNCSRSQSTLPKEGDSGRRHHELSVTSYSSQSARASRDTVDPFKREFKFAINNRNPSLFGSTIDLGPDAGNGPRSLALLGPYAYIIDGVHDNIKRVDLRSGKLSSARIGSNSYAAISSHGGLLYLCTFSGDVVVSDSDMNQSKLIESHLPPDARSGDLNFLHGPGQPLRLLTRRGVVSIANDTASLESFSSAARGTYDQLYEQAVIAATTTDSNSWYVRLWSGVTLRLPHDIPTPAPLWFANNKDVDSTRLAYYTIEGKQFVLHVMSAPSTSLPDGINRKPSSQDGSR